MSDPPLAICNSGPLVALGKLNRLDLLESVFGEAEITQEVYREVVEEGQAIGNARSVDPHVVCMRVL